MSLYINHSQYLKFADDTKCFLHINTLSDHIALQEDITAIFTWSLDSNMDFRNLFTFYLKASWIPYTPYLIHAYHTPIPIPGTNTLYYKTITSRAYKMLGLICRTLSSCHSTTTMTRLYVSLVRSQLFFYCTQVWQPHLMKDILNIE